MKMTFPALCAVVFLSACVTSQDDFAALQNRVFSLDARMAAQEKAVADLAAKLEDGGNLRTTQADLWSEVEGLRTQLAQTKGTLDELQRSEALGAQAKASDVAELERDVQRIKSALSGQLALDLEEPKPSATVTRSVTTTPDTGGGTATVSEPSAQPKPVTTPTDPAQVLYNQGLDIWRTGDYAKAQAVFAEFLREYPKHELVPNAYFWQGESFFQMNDYANAILRYEEVIQKHKDHPKFRAAMLKEGLAFMELGKPKAGKERLRQLIKSHPDSTEARRAKAILNNQ